MYLSDFTGPVIFFIIEIKSITDSEHSPFV